jgi:hypothetical protein
MTLEDDTTSPVPTIPTALLAGIITDDPRDESTDDVIQASLASACTDLQPTTYLGTIQTATTSDEYMILLLSLIEDGFPEKRCLVPTSIREFHNH